MLGRTITVLLALWTTGPVWAEGGPHLGDDFHWEAGPPVVTPRDVGGISVYSIKDPSIVRYQDRWHLFCTIRGKERSHAVVYVNFKDWPQANDAEWKLLSMHEGYFCAPQVFYFRPHKKWYLICQAAKEEWEPNYQPAFSTTETLDDPESWSALEPLYGYKPDNLKGWIDFWVVCDTERAHLFFTSNDGNMWRAQTRLANFPRGWSKPQLVLQGDIFEASHTYKLKGDERYLTVVEAQHGHGWRYYKAYLADGLDGEWKPLAATKESALASMKNVQQLNGRWTDSISHGELLRTGYDEQLEVDPDDLRFLFQGVLEKDRQGKKYGEIPWKLGLLKRTSPP